MVSLLVLTLSACGFTLRGMNQPALSFDRMSLVVPEGFYPLADPLTETLRANNVTLPEPATPSQGFALALGPETLERRTISINTRAGAGQYELMLSVDASLFIDGELIGTETITTRGTFFEDTANISGSNTGEDLALQDMRRTMAEQILRQLQALNL